MKLDIPDPQPIAARIPSNLDILIYGPSGTGKTECAATWETPILMLDSDDGLLSITASTRINQSQKDNIYHLPIKDQADDPHVKQPVGWLTAKTVIETISKEGEFAGLKPRTIVADSLTTLSEMAMNFVLVNEGKSLQAQPTLPNYGRQMKELIDFIHFGVACPCNFICIAHQQFIKDELTGRIWCLPLVTGKLAQNLPNFFDEVYHAETKPAGTGKFTYRLATKPNGLIVAKSRLDLSAEIEAHYNSVSSVVTSLKTKAQQTLASAGQKGGGATQAAQKLGINP